MSDKYCTIEDEYKKNKNLKKEDVAIILEWINKQAHLPKINETRVIAFLHACYYKIEPTKVCIDNFFTVRAHWPEFINDRDIFSKELQQTMRLVLATVLPIPSKQNYLVMYSRLMDTRTDNYNHVAQIKLFDMIASMWFRILGTSDGQMLLMDMEGVAIGHLLKVNLAAIKKHMYYIQEAFPIRLKGIHLINVSPVTDKLLSMAKPFMNKGMVDLIHLHPKMETLYEYIPKDALPKEYGGLAGTFKELHEKQIKMLEFNAKFLLEEAKEVADESKRQGKAKNLDNIFGIEGTFKKLDID